ncbi:MAG: hypothetical protein NTW61_07920 [Candidatus Melainabacteria bacterium]|nr:hypothetical protein [Candidatus Melainabacteria bacterium]
MTAIGGGNQPSNSHQRKLAHSEEWIAKYKERVGTYPAMPIELSPNNGVPTEEVLDTFHRMAEKFDIPVTTDLDNNALPVGKRGYKQLLNTLASIVENGSGFLGRIQKVAFEKDDDIGASMSERGQLIFNYLNKKMEGMAYVVPPESSVLPAEHQSYLDIMNPYKERLEGSLRTPATLTTEHEAVHDLLMGACREFLEISKFKSVKHPSDMADSIMKFYTNQLYAQNPTIVNNALQYNMLTPYLVEHPQELFTTLFEAYASEIASRTPITPEMAYTVGSRVDHLTEQTEAHLPNVSPEQKKQLTELIDLIKDTPFNLKGWWQEQTQLDYELVRSLNLPPVDYSNLPNVDELLDEDFFKHEEDSESIVKNFANLDREHPALYQFILELDKQHPEVMGASFRRDIDAASKVMQTLFESEQTAVEKPLSKIACLLYPGSQKTEKELLRSRESHILNSLQELHSSYQFIEATGGRPANDDLFYSRHRAEGLAIPEHPNAAAHRAEVKLRKLAAETAKTAARAKFLAENAHLLDLPKRFMTMLENLDEKELMITMLHRLV